MVRIAILDANVLWPQYLRDVLLSAADLELYRCHWTEQILQEMRRSQVRQGHLTANRADAVINTMCEAFPEAMVSGYEALIPLMTNDEKDRHVLAAAVHIQADTIVTCNTKDFPLTSLKPHYIGLDTPDDFLTDLWIGNQGRMARAMVRMARRLRKPPMTLPQLVGEVLSKHAPTFAEMALADPAPLQIAIQAESDGIPLPELRLF